MLPGHLLTLLLLLPCARVANFRMVEAKEEEAAAAAAEAERQRLEQEAAEAQRKAEEEAAAVAAATAAAQPLGKEANADFWKSLLGDKYSEEVVQQVWGGGA